MKSRTGLFWIVLLAGAIGVGQPHGAAAAVKIDSHTFAGLQARAIGPAVMGGRIAAIDAIEQERLTIYVGAAGGGVWKSVDGGTTFKPVFDKYTQSIGAITIDRANPDTVWVGTGETWTRNSTSVGTGIYKTTDGGENWKLLGLEDSERINRILIDPTDGDTAYVCVTGHLWNANEQRGVYKTTDGGKNWQRVLYVDENTGCGGMAIDPQDARILYANMWQFRRWPYFFKSGGPGSGIYKSIDGGDSWQKVTKGLPEGELGRVALAVAPTRPNVVYATVESEKTRLYRSNDLGESWHVMGSDANVEARPFYFSVLVVDPRDYNRVYKPGSMISVSTDGGETFGDLGGGIHPDVHALWINPKNPHHIIVGTDGGVYSSHDRGMHWNFLQGLPVSQFYQLSVDMDDPYQVYGGLQDNGTWMGPSRAPGGIQNHHWRSIGSGDGFHAYVDRGDSDIVYVEWQGGRIQRMRKSTGESKDIKPLPEAGDPKYRFNWNTAMHLSPTRPDTLYLGGQFLFRSRNRGDTWKKISPDLTTNDPEKLNQIESGGLTPDNSTAENYCSIYTIAESPLNDRIVWVGTDDGNVQITRDSGATWTNVTDRIPNLPKGTWVSHIHASVHDEGTAFATFDGHRTGDMKPYVYRTTDHGHSWKALGTDGIDSYCHVIVQDPVNPELLFLGTEFGLFISIDGGSQWARFKKDFPKVGVRAMVIHPREHDLILATHGRGVYIIDDLTPLRHLTGKVLNSKAALLPSRPTVMRIPSGVQQFPGDDEFVGSNPRSGAQISYYLKRRHLFGDLRVEVYDPQGNLLAEIPGGKRRGINRVSWFMREKPPKVPPASSLVPQMFSFLGPQVPEGQYTVKLIRGKDVQESKITLVPDPRADYTAKGRALQDKLVTRLYKMLRRLTYVVDTIVDVQKQAKSRLAGLDVDGDLAAKVQRFIDEMETFRKSLVATRKGGFLAGEEQLREKLTDVYGAVNGYEGRPTDSQIAFTDVLDHRLTGAAAQLVRHVADPLDNLNAELTRNGLDAIKGMSRKQWEAKQDDTK